MATTTIAATTMTATTTTTTAITTTMAIKTINLLLATPIALLLTFPIPAQTTTQVRSILLEAALVVLPVHKVLLV